MRRRLSGLSGRVSEPPIKDHRWQFESERLGNLAAFGDLEVDRQPHQDHRNHDADPVMARFSG
jgi:hypothetical protein